MPKPIAEDWQERDKRIQRAVEEAVRAADCIILDASDGSVEETNLLTARVMLQFATKVEISARRPVGRMWQEKADNDRA